MSKLIIPYIKAKIKYISVITVFLAIFIMLFFAFSLPMEIIVYGMLVFAVFLAVFIGLDFVKTYRKHMQLQNFTGTALFGGEQPEARGIIENDYKEIIELLIEENAALASRYDIKEKEMDDYYTMWVHQIKTPISAMDLMLQNDEINKSKFKAELFKTEQYAEMALAYLRLESIHSDLAFTEHDVDAIVKKALKKFARIFALRRISLDMGRVEIRAVTDEKWLGFVIEQLLSNALKYTKEGGMVKIYSFGRRLTIEDNGMGIHKEDLPRVFEKGFTGYNGRTDKKSTGLGLYLCKKTLSALSHSISIESDERGTRANILFSESGVDVSD